MCPICDYLAAVAIKEPELLTVPTHTRSADTVTNSYRNQHGGSEENSPVLTVRFNNNVDAMSDCVSPLGKLTTTRYHGALVIVHMWFT